ncbi:MAG: CHAD domain-containing protein [Candidatus Accumulibacter sp.]|uniref:CYTH and CHAD domain-containing protein n=1 Tax=Accumulibacter sp. TaxID=2053492 RepID=UPI0025F4AD95|nr:CYTH and CHAD domain-containing protein [Accumulibacter sp.]MCP5249635.1 CHAD domain-containing protein [Accumulibacter sp.]
MATETEVKLSLSARSASQLSRHPLLAELEPQRQRLINTYYDTADNRLRKEGIVVRHRQKGRQWLCGVKTAVPLSGGLAQRKEWEFPGHPGEFDFSRVDQSSVRDLVEALRDQLQPLFTTRFTRTAWMLEPRAGVRVEVALDRGWIDAGGRREEIREVELELCAGAVSDLFEVTAALQAGLRLHPEARSKSDRAYRLLADLPVTAAKAIAIPIDAGLSTIATFRLVALACVNHLQRNEQGLCQTDAPEFVHQARVAIRRLRSAIRVWQRHLPEAFVARFDPLWRELAQGLGEARNWDVFLAATLPVLGESLPDSRGIDQLHTRARQRCRSSRQLARRALSSPAYSRLLVDFTAALLALPEASPAPVGSFVPAWLEKCTRRVNQRALHALGSDDAARHRLRLAFKQLRYAVEFFSPLFAAGPALDNYQQAVAALQELLGSQNDLTVAMQLTGETLPAAVAAPILDWLGRQSESLLPELGARLDNFRQQQTPWQQLSA